MKSISFKDKFEKRVEESIRSNGEVQDAINGVVESRFDRVLDELRAEREESARKFDENIRRWKESNKKWEEAARQSRESDRKWEEDNQRWKESNKKWEEAARQSRENDRKWEEDHQILLKNQIAIERALDDIAAIKVDNKSLHAHYDQTIGALGTRWGLYTEKSFRNALKGLLEETTSYRVLNVIEQDDDGVVFGWPAQIELDIVIQNGKFFIVEIKSSISGGDVATFVKKARFYEQRHNKKANALVIISPMIDDRAREFINNLGIMAYSYATYVAPDILE